MNNSRRKMPDIDKLRAFECAARHASFTGAAGELNLTQSAISRQIKELEEQIGIPLFARVKQRVVLSNAGRMFLLDVRRLLAQTHEAMLRVMSTPEGSSLSLATVPTFGERWLMPRLPDFIARNPGVALSLASYRVRRQHQ